MTKSFDIKDNTIRGLVSRVLHRAFPLDEFQESMVHALFLPLQEGLFWKECTAAYCSIRFSNSLEWAGYGVMDL